MLALLISTYELGRQPFGLASPAAWLRREGWEVDCVDSAKGRLEEVRLRRADLIGLHLPMHTATRLAGPVIQQARRLNRAARICAYGLYAPLNEPWLRSMGVDEVLGGEFESDLAQIARRMAAKGEESLASTPPPVRLQTSDTCTPEPPKRANRIPRLQFLVPDRTGLPPLTRYASLLMPDGSRKVVGSTEASRGCKHLCRHCPVVPVYQGQFRIVQPDVVLADVHAQVEAGASHITFGDPDFFNGPTHAINIVEALHAAHPSVTFDVTIKIEHLLKYQQLLPRLRDAGCAFVTSAVESLDDRVLALLDKGHTRNDFYTAVTICRAARISLVPTFVAFHPWLTLDDYCSLLDAVRRLELIDHVAPIQFAIRLLVTEGSRLLELPEVRNQLHAFDAATLSYPWTHADPAVDALHRDVMRIVGTSLASDRREVFDRICVLAHGRAGLPPATRSTGGARAVPYLSEPWYCCAEPNPEDVRLI